MRLRRVVLSYPNASSEFKFDLSLNYRLSSVIHCYSDQKPTLVVREVVAVVGGSDTENRWNALIRVEFKVEVPVMTKSTHNNV